MILSPRLVECLEKILVESDDALSYFKELDAQQAVVLLDLERKLYAVRRCISKEYQCEMAEMTKRLYPSEPTKEKP